MSLSDMEEEERNIREMNEAHAHREKHEEYCSNCNGYFSRYLPHTCRKPVKDTFKADLRAFLNACMKEGSVDEDLADSIMYEWDKDHQQEWLDRMEVRQQDAVDREEEGNE